MLGFECVSTVSLKAMQHGQEMMGGLGGCLEEDFIAISLLLVGVCSSVV